MNAPDLFEYQVEGRDFLAATPRGMLGDQPGLGKTPQAIRAAAKVFGWGAPKICVICPKTAMTNWKREWARWWPTFGGFLMIVNYDRLSIETNERHTFTKGPWDLIICDEAHRLKSPGAKRTKTVYDHVGKYDATWVWLLTGTPARNHAGELWTHLTALRPDLIHDRSGRPMAVEQFEDAYCKVQHDAFGARVIRGSKNVKELREKLADGGFILRRMKKDVQSQLPDLIFDEYPLPQRVDATPVNYPDFAGMGIQEGMTFDEIVEVLRRAGTQFSTERRHTGMLKVPSVAAFVDEELEAPGKIIVFFHHTDVGEALKDRLVLHNPVIVNGKTKDAQAQVDKFQTDPDCRVFLGQITACGEALNITAATQVVFAEASWSPADNYQAACRAHRIGMGDSLVVRFLSAEGTMDEIIQRVLTRKSRELAELFD